MYHSRPVGPLEAWRTRRRFAAVARAADWVIAGNDYLANLFRAEGATVKVLPTVVDPAHYGVKNHAETQSPTLVWIGSRSTLSYLRQFTDALSAAAARVPGLRLITIADEPLANPPIPAEHVEWSESAESAALLRGDIGIAPTPEDRWTLGKCGFKIVQYLATGLPVVASPVGANTEIVTAGVTGFLPQSTPDWADAIATLAADVHLRQTMGAAGRTRVEQNLCLESAAKVWADLLSKS
jgi:glycosyltransferase involved in cell wall biosynthesis